MSSKYKCASSEELREHLLDGDGDQQSDDVELANIPRRKFHVEHEAGWHFPWWRSGFWRGVLVGLALPLLVFFVHGVSHSFDLPVVSLNNVTLPAAIDDSTVESAAVVSSSAPERPDGIKIVGVVFYGRRQFVDILDCYLRRNLVSNGGYIDEIHFLLHPVDDKETPWLQQLIANSPGLASQYKLFHHEKDSFVDLWSHFNESDTLYIKLDDDLIYLHEDAIPNLVNEFIAHPEVHSMQSNIINSGWSHWLHWHTDAVHAYLPDLRKINVPLTDWRASSLPPFRGDPRMIDPAKIELEGRHRWLPLAHDSAEALELTPIMYSRPPLNDIHSDMERNPWEIGAQELYSLLQNIEANATSLYWAGNEHGIWNLWYTHYSISLMAIWGRDLSLGVLKQMSSEDETALTEQLPAESHRPVKIATHSIAAHFSSYKQRSAMLRTDLLDRFRLYANEKVCAADNQKVPFPVEPGCSLVDIFVC